MDAVCESWEKKIGEIKEKKSGVVLRLILMEKKKRERERNDNFYSFLMIL
jgi:hypothetical protein